MEDLQLPPDIEPEFLVEELVKQLKEAQHELCRLQDQNKDLADELSNLTEQLADEAKAHEDAKTSFINAQRENKSKDITIGKAEDANDDLQKETEAQQKKIHQILEKARRVRQEKRENDEMINVQREKLEAYDREVKELKHRLASMGSEFASMKTECHARVAEGERKNLILLERLRKAMQTNDIAEHAMIETVQRPSDTWPGLDLPSQSGQILPFDTHKTLNEELQNSLYSLSEGTASQSSLATFFGQQAQPDRETNLTGLPDAPPLPSQNQVPAVEAVAVDWGNAEQAAHAGVIPFLGDLSNANRKRSSDYWQTTDGSHDVGNVFSPGKKICVAPGQRKPDPEAEYLRSLQEASFRKDGQARQSPRLSNPVTSQSHWSRNYRTVAVQTLDDVPKAQPTATVISVKPPGKPERKPESFLPRGPNYSGPIYLSKKYDSHPLEVEPFRTTPKAWTNLSDPSASDGNGDDQPPDSGNSRNTDNADTRSLRVRFVPAATTAETIQMRATEQSPLPAWIEVVWALLVFGMLLVVWAEIGRLIRWWNGTQEWMHYNEVPEDVLRMVRGSKPSGMRWVQKVDYRLARFVNIKSGWLG
ncbi:uncharacterized protein BO80DRAFT_424078 [Aspergillus ibericus CBS 121593]|uniref:Uncharacterized protein n=1 Tax=Aspergillus ibericus CBS 121593 TaxID=1448316 RepID=A0A395H2P6_9EURO|nr:hypothetical protein BO80DRAFT_424078 [Aspergillus ibericus CBS 121593]RAL02157.1 hypothetical protein BO80DRAFT_424078 [Aspergillus ibericus CBS 121593]